MIRKLWLENENEEVYSFNDVNTCFASNLSGLGFSKVNSYFEYATTFVTATSKEPMTKIQMMLTFMQGYISYADFLKYLSKSKELKLYYQNDSDTKYVLVDVERIDKTEKVTETTLNCPIVFNKKTMWMKKFKVSLTDKTDAQHKTYEYRYDYKYATEIDGTLYVNNRGSVAAPLNYSIQGSVNNPVVQILVNDKVVSESKINITYENATLEVIAEEGKESMTVTLSTGEVKNVYQNQDFTKEGFLFIPPGEASVKINPGSVSSTHVFNLTFHELYRGN